MTKTSTEKPKETSTEAGSENKEIIIPEQQPKLSVTGLISQGLAAGASVEAMKGLYELFAQERADQRRIAFNDAMGKFQAECPTIKKTKAVKGYDNQIKYFYAPLESIVEQVKGLIKENGFSYRIQSEMTEAGVKATCIVKHREGHEESTSVEVSKMKAPTSSSGKALMSAPQEDAATLTYAKRYAFCNAFGILTGDDDTDAAPAAGTTARRVAKTEEIPDETEAMRLARKAVNACRTAVQLDEVRGRIADHPTLENQEKIKLYELIQSRKTALGAGK